MSNPKISIVLSDRNWILERLGSELQTRIENIALNDAADPSADINYYITFACRKRQMPTLEMALFTHMERTPELQELFYKIAREVDLPVAMSNLYRDMLHKEGITKAVTISPGVDHNRFDVKLRIGVVGRAYHTGRKGEALIAQLMDMEGIDWHFTGSGWPKPSRYYTDEELPDFYRSMDFILVPALYEGGPMCVPEALAVGTPVIASNVGWVPEFPHIPFKNGDAEDLRRVLNEQLEIKKQLRASTEAYSWDNYAAAHERVFFDLMKRAEKSPKRSQGAAKPTISAPPVTLLLHGEEGTTLGGPSVRVPRTAAALRALGVSATASVFDRPDRVKTDMVHLFNVWAPQTALSALRRLKAAGKRVVFSPIYLDLSERDFWHNQLPHLPLDEPEILAKLYEEARQHQTGRGRLPEAVPGYNAMVREMLTLADHVVFLSQVERQALERLGAKVEDDRASLVHNPVEPEDWAGGDPALFRDHCLADHPGAQDYVLCIGRIETRKNQLMLAQAIRGLPLRLVLVGHEGDPAYAERIRQIGGDQVLMVGRLEHGSDMLKSALAGAKVFALPSWAEGASLAALEAAAAGSNMVLSDRSSEREYFGDLAHYCDPGDPESIRQAIKAALATPSHRRSAAKLQALVSKNNSWEQYARATARAYARAAEAPLRAAPQMALPAPRHSPKLVFDITTLAHHQGRITGISRVESILAQHLPRTEAELTFICWNDMLRQFIEVPRQFARIHHAVRYNSQFDNQTDTPEVTLPEDCTVVVPGSGWMQNSRYVKGLEALKMRNNCGLISVVYDLVPFKFPFWFQGGYAPVFQENFYRLAAISDQILTDSQSCAEDVVAVLEAQGRALPPVTPIRLGDPHFSRAETPDEPLAPEAPQNRFAHKKFVLAVGAIHTRKNYEMLYRVWARFADECKHQDLHLVIVGGVAWNGKALAEQIAADQRVNKRIHILSGISDADLAWLYETCLFTAFPSHYEGWGLPVAESLMHGKLCLATSASSVPEIAPEFVEHIDPEDFATWHTKISFYAGSPAARSAKENAIRAGYQPVSWDQTAQDILTIVKQPRVVTGLQPLEFGAITETNTTLPPLALRFDGNWHPAESWGRWARAGQCSVTLNVSAALREGQRDVRLLIRQKLPPRPHGHPNTRLRIHSGPRQWFSASLGRHAFIEELILTIPADAIPEDGLLTLEWQLPPARENLKSPSSQRQLGIGLIAITLLDPDYSNPLHYLRQTQNWFDGEGAMEIDLSNRVHRHLLANDLAYSTAWGLGSMVGSFEILVPVLPGGMDRTLQIDLRPVASPETPVTAHFHVNGAPLCSKTWTDDAPTQIRATVDAAVLARSSPAVISVETDSLLSPGEVKIGSSHDLVGLGVTNVRLTAKGGEE